jgi:protease-4
MTNENHSENSTQSNESAKENSSWEQKTMEKILLEGIKEQRRKRRWGIFFKLIFFAWLLLFISVLLPDKQITDASKMKKHIGLIDINGPIFDGADASSDHVVASLAKAMKDPKTVAVILRINSPGGSPVQADDIYNNIMRLKKDYPTKKVYAVCRDVCASAAYYIASAADEIYANQASLVGSIGVLMDGFGFTGTMSKLGIERRLFTAGDEKGFLDPFSPIKPEDEAFAKQMLEQVHQQFIAAVKNGRGNRLQNNPQLFSGLAWTGYQAKSLGLIDGFGSAGYIARNLVHVDSMVDYTRKSNFFDQISRNMGASFSHEIASILGLQPLQLR